MAVKTGDNLINDRIEVLRGNIKEGFGWAYELAGNRRILQVPAWTNTGWLTYNDAGSGNLPHFYYSLNGIKVTRITHFDTKLNVCGNDASI